jgi:hypothetical protein
MERWLPGSLPLLLWPIDFQILRHYLFREVVVVSIHNPAHLASRIRALGFDVSADSQFQWCIEFSGSPEPLHIWNSWVLKALVGNCLVHEEMIVAMVKHQRDMALSGSYPSGSKIMIGMEAQAWM